MITNADEDDSFVVIVDPESKVSTRCFLFGRAKGAGLSAVAGTQHGAAMRIARLFRAVVGLRTAVVGPDTVRVGQDDVVDTDDATATAVQIHIPSLADRHCNRGT